MVAKWKGAALLLAAAAALTPSGLAQTTGQIRGRVADGDGGYISGVAVEATSPQAGTHTVESDDGGRYAIPNLPPGAYTVRFRKEGYAPVDKKARVPLDGRATVDAKLFKIS